MYEFSLTISKRRTDVDAGEIAKVQEWLDAAVHCQDYVMGIERGGTLNHLHMQCLVRALTSSSKHFSREVRVMLGWHEGALKTDGSISAKSLSGKDMHTWVGMIGYCTKDAGRPDYQVFSKGVSTADFIMGRDRYAQFASVNKNEVLLTPHNILERAHMYYKTFIARPASGSCVGETRVRMTCTEVILAMVHTGKYKMSSVWAKEKKLDRGTLNLLWKSLVLPEATSLHELEGILIDTGDKRSRYCDAKNSLAPDGNPYTIPQTSTAIRDFLQSGGKRKGPGKAGAMIGMMRASKYRAPPPKRIMEDRSFGLETYLGDDDFGAVLSSQGNHNGHESDMSCPSDLEDNDPEPVERVQVIDSDNDSSQDEEEVTSDGENDGDCT